MTDPYLRRDGRPRTRTIDVKGYVRIGEHFEHRLVAATMLGRPLRCDELVHHRNRDRTDNRPDNLEILSANEHARRHVGERRTAGRFAVPQPSHNTRSA